jgi:hypothetical protein
MMEIIIGAVYASGFSNLKEISKFFLALNANTECFGNTRYFFSLFTNSQGLGHWVIQRPVITQHNIHI